MPLQTAHGALAAVEIPRQANIIKLPNVSASLPQLKETRFGEVTCHLGPVTWGTYGIAELGFFNLWQLSPVRGEPLPSCPISASAKCSDRDDNRGLTKRRSEVVVYSLSIYCSWSLFFWQLTNVTNVMCQLIRSQVSGFGVLVLVSACNQRRVVDSRSSLCVPLTHAAMISKEAYSS